MTLPPHFTLEESAFEARISYLKILGKAQNKEDFEIKGKYNNNLVLTSFEALMKEINVFDNTNMEVSSQ